MHACLASAAVAVASHWYGAHVVFLLVGALRVLAGVCDSHQSALYSKTLVRHIVGAVHFDFEPEVEFPE